MLAGWDEVVGVELSDEYADIARARLAWWEANRDKAPTTGAMRGEPALANHPNGRPAKTATAAYGNFAGDHAPPRAATLDQLPLAVNE